MKKFYVKSLKEYEKPIQFDSEVIIEAMVRAKNGKKRPTSIALENSTIQNLKMLGSKMGIPHQVLMRLFILEGLKRFKAI